MIGSSVRGARIWKFSPMASSSMSLEKAFASLIFAEEDEDGLIINNEDVRESEEEYRLVLVGKLATEKPIRFNIMRDMRYHGLSMETRKRNEGNKTCS